MLTAASVAGLVQEELASIEDTALAARIRKLLVASYPVERDWDYGAEGETVTCWTVLEHPDSNTGIAYAAKGFGPATPWGLVSLRGAHMSVGPNCHRAHAVFCAL